MMILDIKLIGDRALAKALLGSGPIIDSEIDAALEEIGLIGQRESRRNAPRDEGDLERSIQFKVGSGFVDILVPTNSRAGKYAKIRHDGRYKRGPGTRAKGGRAGRKYISRAIRDNRQKFDRRFQRIRAILRARF